MSDVHTSMTTKALFAAAKADVPSEAARASMWNGVSSALGGAASAGGASASIGVSTGAGATKLLVMGGLFGATVTVGLAAVLLKIGAAPVSVPPTKANPAVVVQAGLSGAERPAAQDSTSVVSPAHSPKTSAPSSGRGTPRRLAGPAGHEGSLAREAMLVAQARAALGRGDSAAALHAIRAARALPSGQLAPEELAVEEQALRALGQSDEANGINVQLRLQYPESALAR